MDRQRQLVLERFPSIEAGKYSEGFSIYTDKDRNWAVIPPGWVVSGIPKENTIWGNNVGLVIYQVPKNKVNCINWNDEKMVEELKRNYNQFVWVPVDLLDANGTLDGKTFNQKFGRRNYKNTLSHEDFCELHEFYGSCCDQINSANVYGGFYISRYLISNKKDRPMYSNLKPFSVKGYKPWVYLNYQDSEKIASNVVEKTDYVTSHLIYGTEYDCVLEWLVKSGVRTRKEIEEESENCVISNLNEDFRDISSPIKTGSSEKYALNNLYEFVGNVQIRTQEFVDIYSRFSEEYNLVQMHHTARGFGYRFLGNVAMRSVISDYTYLHTLGIRACLCISCFSK